MDPTSDPSRNKTYQPRLRDFAALLTGNVTLALGALLVRWADTGPVAAGFWRMTLPIPLFALLAWRESGGRLPRARNLLLLVIAGMFFALDIAAWHLGIGLTKLANSTLFGNAGSLILMVWGLFVLRRLPTKGEAAAVLAALGGAAILLGRSLEISLDTVKGDLLSFLAGLFYVAYLLPAQKVRGEMGPWSVLVVVCLAASPLLLVAAHALDEPVWPGTAGWGPVVALAISSQILGQGLLVYSLKHFGPLIIGLSLLIQPAVAALSGWLAFGETLGGLDLLGMALVGGALVVAKLSDAGAPAKISETPSGT